MSSKLDNVLQKSIATVPECVAAGYVDLNTGMLLGIKTVDSHPREVLDLLAAATSDMFQGANVQSIEKLFKKTRGVKDDNNHHYFTEMIVNSDNLIHIFVRTKKNEDQVAGFICRKSANLGMALTKARAMVPELESAV